ncbi:MAG: HD domain-containing protein, partial [Nitrospirae bacterium]|nr:HD domain-containing protein [Nitrospirota bacterium]
MRDTILLVDDEINILNSLKRLFINDDLRIIIALNADEAMNALKDNKVSVIVSDNRMPNITGIEFLQKAKEVSPESVRILLTAYADIHSAIDAINKGEVYRYISKPWNDDEFRDTVSNAINRYKVVMSLKSGDEAILLSLAQTIELKDPYTRGHCDRVAKYAIKIAESLGLSEEEKKCIKYGSWLHDCGKIGVPESILNLNGPLSDEQINLIKNNSRWGADVARLARLPVAVVNIILYHHEKYDGTGYPEGLKGKDIPLEARLVSVADFYDAFSSDRPYRKKYSSENISKILDDLKGRHFDPE